MIKDSSAFFLPEVLKFTSHTVTYLIYLELGFWVWVDRSNFILQNG